MDSSSFPIDATMVRGYAIEAWMFITILDNDPLVLPIAGLTTDLKLYIIQGSATTLRFSLPRRPTADVTVQITVVSA